MPNFPISYDDNESLYLAVNNKRTNLTAGITDSDTVIPVTTTSGFPPTGFISILTGTDITDTEAIKYSSTTDTTFIASQRGAGNTIALEHFINDNVDLTIVEDHHNELKDAVIALEHFVGVSGSEQFPRFDNTQVITVSGVTVTGGGQVKVICANPDFMDLELSPDLAFQDSVQQTNSTSFIDANCETGVLQKGITYLVMYQGGLTGIDTTNSAHGQVLYGTTALGDVLDRQVSPSSLRAGNSNSIHSFAIIEGDGESTLKFQFRKVAGTNQSAIDTMAILAVPLNKFFPAEDYFFASQEGEDYTVVNAPTTSGQPDNKILDFSVNIKDRGNYVYLGTVEGREDNQPTAGRGFSVRFLLDDAQIGPVYRRARISGGTTDFLNVFTHMDDVLLNPGVHTFSIDVSSVGAATADYRRARHFLFRKSAFDQFRGSLRNATSTTENTSYVDTGVGINYTSNQNEDVVIMTHGVMIRDDFQLHGLTQLRRVGDGATARADTGTIQYTSDEASLGGDVMSTMMFHTVTGVAAGSQDWDMQFSSLPNVAGVGPFVHLGFAKSGVGTRMFMWPLVRSNDFDPIECTAITCTGISTHYLDADDVRVRRGLDVGEYLTVSGKPVAIDAAAAVPDPLTLDTIVVNTSLTVSGTPVLTEVPDPLNIGTVNASTSLTISGIAVPLTGSSLTVEDQDASPSVSNVNTIRVTNGTLTDEGGGVVSITTGGGSGATISGALLGNTRWDPFIPPDTASAFDDEFNDESLDAKWDLFDPGSDITATDEISTPNRLRIQQTPSDTLGGYTQDRVPADGDFTFVTYIDTSTRTSRSASLEHFHGLALIEDTGAPSTSNVLFYGAHWDKTGTTKGDPVPFEIGFWEFSQYDAAESQIPSAAGNTINFSDFTIPGLFLRIRITAGGIAIDADWSLDGVGWHEMVSETLGAGDITMTTYEAIGILSRAGGDTQHNSEYRFFRLLEGDRALEDTLPAGLLGGIVDADTSLFTAVTGTFTQSLTISGVPVATGTGGGTASTLQDAYDNGDGTITTSALKPFELQGTGELVAVTGTFTEGLTIGTSSTVLNDHSITTASGVFTESLTLSGLPVSITPGGGSSIDDINGISSGSITVEGAGQVFVSTAGQAITVSGTPHPNVHAIEGADGITIISGSNIVTVSGFQTEFVSASGSLQTQLDSHTGDATIHFTEASIDHTAILNIGSNTHAEIDTHLQNLTTSGVATDANIVSVSGHLQTQIDGISVTVTLQDAYDDSTSPEIVLSAGNGALTIRDASSPIGANLLEIQNNAGSSTFFSVDANSINAGVDIDPTSDSTIALGSSSTRFNEMYGTFVMGLQGNKTRTIDADPAGIVAGFQGGAGTAEHVFEDGSPYGYKPICMITNAFAYGAGATARTRVAKGAAVMFGSAFAYGNQTAIMESEGYASFTGGYAYAASSAGSASYIYNNASGAFIWTYAWGNGGTANATVGAVGNGAFVQGFINAAGAGTLSAGSQGSFAQGFVRSNGTGDATIDVNTDSTGGFAQGSSLASTTRTTRIRAGSDGAFAQGFAQGASGDSYLEATGLGSFAHGHALNDDILAVGAGSFAVGQTTTRNIVASGTNSAQFGPGMNEQGNALQVGDANAGVRLNGGGAPSTLQNGDIWVASGYVYIRSNGVSVQIT